MLFRKQLIRALSEYELNPEQWQILSVLCENESPVYQSELAQITGKDRHSISKMVQKMENSGWVKREPSEENLKVLFVRPTKKATSSYPTIRKTLIEHFSSFFSQVSRKDLEDFSDLCSKFINILDV